VIRNLILVAIHNLKKDKQYSLLNILGLTIGVTFSLFLIFYILDELSYDRYHQKANRIYRIAAFVKEAENSMQWANTQFPWGPALKKDYPEVEEAVRLVRADRAMYKNGELQFYETKIYFADSNLFRVFTYKFIDGNPLTALVESVEVRSRDYLPSKWIEGQFCNNFTFAIEEIKFFNKGVKINKNACRIKPSFRALCIK
jgi:putative ABC transport system permease protein